MAEENVRTDLTRDEFLALVSELQPFAHAHPINILERLQSGLGAPWEHRRDFRYHGQSARVLLTEDIFNLSSGPVRRVHLSVVSLEDDLLPVSLHEEIVNAFFPGRGEPQSVLKVGLAPGKLLTMPSAIPGCTQYVVVAPLGTS